jgi:hypothetical protein
MVTSTAPNRDVEFPVVVEAPSAAGSQPSHRAAGTEHFLRHFGEMFLAMMIGMCGLGALDGLILSVAGTSVTHVRDSAPEVVGIVMALNMTVGMTVWMRHRRHSWAMCAEMAAAMLVPAILAIALFWAGMLPSGRSIAAAEMVVMVPAMIAVMLLRRTEYSQPVHKRRS